MFNLYRRIGSNWKMMPLSFETFKDGIDYLNKNKLEYTPDYYLTTCDTEWLYIE